MVITNTPVKIDKVVGLQIGQVGESATSQIKFDVSAWLEKYPDISISVRFKRPGEESVLACSSSLEDDVLTWTVSSWETQIAGVGYAEVRAIDEEGRLAKSKVIPCSIEVCIDGTDESYIPVAVKAYFDDEFERIDTEISSEVDQQISAETVARANADLELSEEITVERERITNLATLDEGSTTGDAELIDIRVGADGVTYNNAGTAVRSQVADLKSAIDDVTEDIEFAVPTAEASNTNSGVTCEVQNDGRLKIYGTSTATRTYLFLNGQNSFAVNSTLLTKRFLLEVIELKCLLVVRLKRTFNFIIHTTHLRMDKFSFQR